MARFVSQWRKSESVKFFFDFSERSSKNRRTDRYKDPIDCGSVWANGGLLYNGGHLGSRQEGEQKCVCGREGRSELCLKYIKSTEQQTPK